MQCNMILSIVFLKFISKSDRLAVRHLTEHLPAKILVTTPVSDGKLLWGAYDKTARPRFPVLTNK